MDSNPDVMKIKTIVLKINSNKSLLFSIAGLCSNHKNLKDNDYVLYDGDRAWKIEVEAKLLEVIERNPKDIRISEENENYILQFEEQNIPLTCLDNRSKNEVVNNLLFHLVMKTEFLNSGKHSFDDTEVKSNKEFSDILLTPNKKAKIEQVSKTKAGMSIVNPVQRKAAVPRGVNFE